LLDLERKRVMGRDAVSDRCTIDVAQFVGPFSVGEPYNLLLFRFVIDNLYTYEERANVGTCIHMWIEKLGESSIFIQASQ
jgi:hypothetical protein